MAPENGLLRKKNAATFRLPKDRPQPLRGNRKGDQKFRERGERERRRTAFQSGFRLSHLHTAAPFHPLHLPSLPPSERPSSLCGETAKATRSLGKEESARGEEPLFKAVSASRTCTHSSTVPPSPPPIPSAFRKTVQPLRRNRKGDRKFRERGERERRRTAFQSGFRLSHLCPPPAEKAPHQLQ